MHPTGQLPAYEWNFSDVEPPVHAGVAHRVYQIERRMTARATSLFCNASFTSCSSLHLVGEPQGQGRKQHFEGGFLGLDNIGAFDRSQKLPGGA